jgi:hypothetical protein
MDSMSISRSCCYRVNLPVPLLCHCSITEERCFWKSYSSSWWWHFFADQQARVTACSVKEGKLDEGQEPLVEWLQRLWVPALVLLTVATGYQYPFSLFVTLVFLMWSTKPTPLSIYVWLEKVQQPHLSFLLYFWNDGCFTQLVVRPGKSHGTSKT